jgi:hypothetical protein
LEVGAEGEFKLDLRQDHDPGKQKLKGALRTKKSISAIIANTLYTLASRLQKQKASFNPYMVACNSIGYFNPSAM